MLNNDLQEAKNAKKDEFYTQISDIEIEMEHYKHHFAGKTVYCNCDSPTESMFYKYFVDNLEALNCKKVITRGVSILGSEKIYSVATTDKKQRFPMVGCGDFREKEALSLLATSDIVVTNPPFSLFREYLAQLIEYDKKFIILGNVNAISYKEVFNLIKENKIWLGASIKSGDREFGVPNDYPLEAATCREDSNGNRFIRVKGVRWFTNLDYADRYSHEISLTKIYKPTDYPKYDNFDAINVNKVKDIPMDYYGLIGVPITFLDKYNPNQFEIVGNEYAFDIKGGRTYVGGKRMYSRIFIRRKENGWNT